MKAFLDGPPSLWLWGVSCVLLSSPGNPQRPTLEKMVVISLCFVEIPQNITDTLFRE